MGKQQPSGQQVTARHVTAGARAWWSGHQAEALNAPPGSVARAPGKAHPHKHGDRFIILGFIGVPEAVIKEVIAQIVIVARPGSQIFLISPARSIEVDPRMERRGHSRGRRCRIDDGHLVQTKRLARLGFEKLLHAAAEAQAQFGHAGGHTIDLQEVVDLGVA